MSHGSTQSGSVESPIDLKVVCVVVGALALFAPFLIAIDPVHDLVTITAMTWTYERAQSFSWFRFMEYVYFMAPLPTTVWRVVFVYQMVRYYRGRGTRVGTILLGVLAETFMLGAYIMMILLSPPTISWGWAPLIVPTPLMLVGALVFMWKTPFRQPKTPFGDRAEPDRWWARDTDSESGAPIGSRRENDSADMKGWMKCPMCGNEEIGKEMLLGILGVRAQLIYLCKKCGQRWAG